jgi:hypothetical protein
MMTQPGEGAGAGRGHLRTARADREQVIEALKSAFVQGQLTKDEFGARVGRTLASRTYAELAPLTADIPARPATARPQRPPAAHDQLPPPHPVRNAATVSAGCVIFAALSLLFGALLDDPNTKLFIGMACCAVMGAPLMIVCAVSASLEQRRSRRQRPPRPDGPGPARGAA